MSPQNAPQSPFKRFMMIVALSIFGCLAAVSVYMPKMIRWYAEPPTALGISCAPSIEWALNRLQRAQLYAMAAGLIIGIVLGIYFRKRSDAPALPNQ